MNTPAPTAAVLRQTLYALTRTIGDMDNGTMVEPITRDGHPLASGAFPVQDGAERVAYVTGADVALVSGTVVLADHVAGWTTAFGGFTGEAHARAFAVALLGIASPAVAGVWTGEVIRQQ
jgi:hypothetical protein